MILVPPTTLQMVAKLSVHPAPSRWCVADPGAMTRSTRARPIAATTRPIIAATLWACGWCGRPPALPDLCLLEAASAALPVLAADYSWRPGYAYRPNILLVVDTLKT